MASIHDYTAKDITGADRPLSGFAGKVLLIVNVASKCGSTPQYKGLQTLYEQYRQRGFEVLGFPSNDFAHQEPGTDAEIQNFCTTNYGVTFPMFSKISVKGKDAHPLWAFLADKKANPGFGGKITWNFNKFLVDRSGNVIARFDSKADPRGDKIPRALEEALGR